MMTEMSLRDLAYQTAREMAQQGRWSDRRAKRFVENAKQGSVSRDTVEKRAKDVGVIN